MPSGQPEQPSPNEQESDFAALLRGHIRASGLAKAALARAIATKPQYIREIETGRKPPPTMEKVEILANALNLTGATRDLFLARAREGRTKPESRLYLRNLETAFTSLMEIFAVDADDRESIRKGDFEVMVKHIRDAFMAAGKVTSESDFVPFLQVMRYNSFLKNLLDSMDSLQENCSEKDVHWVQQELLKQMERLVGFRRGETEIFKHLSSGEGE